MGGTSTDVSLVVEGAAQIASDRRLAGQRVALQALDIVSIGAGGGSIARVDAGSRAPRRARERRRRAGTRPATAVAVCRRPSPMPIWCSACSIPDNFLGGRARLDAAAAEAAVDRVAQALGIGRMAAAQGIQLVINTRMAEGIRLVSVRRGVDPRRFAILASAAPRVCMSPSLPASSASSA